MRKKNVSINKDELYHTMLNRILFMEYPSKYILKEEVLAKEFGMSRGPVREVLKRLEWEQLVTTMPRTGTIVTDIEYLRIMQVFQIRLVIETLAGSLAAENVNDSHLSRIKEIRKECEQLGNQVDRKKLVNLDMKFRDVLYDAVGNPILREISRYLYHQTARFHSQLFHPRDWDNAVKTLLDEIDKTYESLSEKDSEETGRLRGVYLKEHLERVKAKWFISFK